MSDTVRLEILRRVERIGELAPDMRFGQLIANLTFMATGSSEKIWDVEDENLLDAVKQLESDLSRRVAEVA